LGVNPVASAMASKLALPSVLRAFNILALWITINSFAADFASSEVTGWFDIVILF
jgi:hypothetical protein